MGRVSLAEFLLARISDDEAHAPDVHNLAEIGQDLWMVSDFGHDAESSGYPERIRRECEVKRQIVEEFAPDLAASGAEQAYAERFLLLLAAMYATHPDCLDDWKV